MADTRLRHYEDGTVMSAAGTLTVDLDGVNSISRATIFARGTNNGSTPTAHPGKLVTDIEIVDGSDRLWHASGLEAQAQNYLEMGQMPFTINETEDGTTVHATYHLNFGRWLWDKEYAFNPTAYNNPQLKITYDRDGGGSAPDAGTLDVFAQEWDAKKVTPSKYLSLKREKSYSLTASAHEYTDLNVDHDIRSITMASLFDGCSPSSQVDKFDLSENGGEKIPFKNESVSDLLKLYAPLVPVEDKLGTLGTASAVEYFVAPTYEAYSTGVGRSATQTALIVSQGSGGTIDITNDASESMQAIVKGWAPHGSLQIPFGELDKPDTWYKMAGIKNLKLDLTAGSSVGSASTCEILTQRAVSI